MVPLTAKVISQLTSSKHNNYNCTASFHQFFKKSAFSRRHNVENAEKHSYLSFPHAGRHEALRADTSNFLIPVFIMHTVVWSTSP